MSRYDDPDQVYDDVPFRVPRGAGWALVCCHCGLTHEVVIEDDGREDTFKATVRQLPSETRRWRRRYDFRCKPTSRKGRPR